MNKIYKIGIIAVTALITVSCGDDWLDTKPLTEKTTGNYYTNPDEAWEALTGCYDGLQLIYNSPKALPVMSVVMSDLCYGGAGAGDDESFAMVDEFDKEVAPGELNHYEESWKQYYVGIFRVNLLLQKLNDVNWGDRINERNIIEAEARFLRAFIYFDMVRIWGRVPLLTEPSVENIPQSEPEEIYKVIAEDLLFASENASKKTYTQLASGDYGQATAWAARGLLARIYLFYTGYYNKTDLLGLITQADVLEYLESIISSSGHGLIDNFADLWPASATYEAAKDGGSITDHTYAGETHEEIVFAIKYTYTSQYGGDTDGNHWLVMNGMRGNTTAESGYAPGWGGCSVIPEVYTNWDTSDTRREASILAVNEEGINYNNTDAREYTGYYTKKYIPTSDTAGNSVAEEAGGVDFMLGQFQDYFILRFSDILLMAAEMGSANALDYVNLVRDRAGVDLLTTIDKDIIFEERRLELAFEGLRYWDLLRYDHTLNYAADKVSHAGTVLTGGVEVTKTIDGNNILKTKGFSQIPYNQITLSGGVLKQNTGW